MGYIDETTKEERTVERLIRFMKSVENPSWMVELVADMRDKLAEYEDLEEQGKLQRLPIAPGDTVYEVQKLRKRIQQYNVIAVIIDRTGYRYYNWELKDGKGIYSNIKGFGEDKIGKTVFLTREDAEAALKELEKRYGK